MNAHFRVYIRNEFFSKDKMFVACDNTIQYRYGDSLFIAGCNSSLSSKYAKSLNAKNIGDKLREYVENKVINITIGKVSLDFTKEPPLLDDVTLPDSPKSIVSWDKLEIKACANESSSSNILKCTRINHNLYIDNDINILMLTTAKFSTETEVQYTNTGSVKIAACYGMEYFNMKYLQSFKNIRAIIVNFIPSECDVYLYGKKFNYDKLESVGFMSSCPEKGKEYIELFSRINHIEYFTAICKYSTDELDFNIISCNNKTYSVADDDSSIDFSFSDSILEFYEN